MQNNKTDFPLALLRDTKGLLSYLRKTAIDNSDIFSSYDMSDNHLFKIEYKENSKFHFTLFTPKLGSDKKSTVQLQYFPKNDNSMEMYSVSILHSDVAKWLDQWMRRIKEYDLITLAEEDSFLRQYQEEFYEEFKIVDEDAEYAAFEHEKMIGLYKMLSLLEVNLNEKAKGDKNILLLVDDIKELKENLQGYSKKVVIKKLSTVLSKLKKKSLKLFMEVVDVAKKEIIKKCLTLGYDETMVTVIDIINP